MSERNKIRPNQYFGKTTTPEEAEQLSKLNPKKRSKLLSKIRKRTRQDFPAVNERLEGSVDEFFTALDHGLEDD